MYKLYIYVLIICRRCVLVIDPSFMDSFYVLVVDGLLVRSMFMYYLYVLVIFLCISYMW